MAYRAAYQRGALTMQQVRATMRHATKSAIARTNAPAAAGRAGQPAALATTFTLSTTTLASAFSSAAFASIGAPSALGLSFSADRSPASVGGTSGVDHSTPSQQAPTGKPAMTGATCATTITEEEGTSNGMAATAGVRRSYCAFPHTLVRASVFRFPAGADDDGM